MSYPFLSMILSAWSAWVIACSHGQPPCIKKDPIQGSNERFLYSLNNDLTWKMLSQKVGKVPSGPVPDSANEICVRVNDTVAFTAPWIAIKDGPHYRFGGYDNGQNFSALININPTQGITLVRAYMGSTSEVAANMTTTVYYR